MGGERLFKPPPPPVGAYVGKKKPRNDPEHQAISIRFFFRDAMLFTVLA